MERWVAKVISMVVAFILPLICMLIPYPTAGYIEKKGATGRMIINRLMCFGGGVFFATFLLHLAPETRATMDEFLLEPNGIDYPLTDLIIGCGFFFVLFLEKVVMKINKRNIQAKKRKLEKINSTSESTHEGSICSEHSDDKKSEELEVVSTDFNNDAMITIVKVASAENALQFPDPDCSQFNSEDSKMSSEITAVDPKAEISDVSSMSSSSDHRDNDHDHDHSHDHDHDNAAQVGHNHHNMRSLFLIMALSLHHLFEGMSLGLQYTVSGVFTLLLALMCHESIISFSMGLGFVKCKYSLKKYIITSICVCAVEPIGIGIGTIMTEVGSESDQVEIASGILQAFAAGTFIFVTFFEILCEEIDAHDTSFGKVASAFVGYILIAALELVPEDAAESEATLTTLSSNLTTIALTTISNSLSG